MTTLLLQAEERFQLPGVGLVIAPELDCPPPGRVFKNFPAEVLVRRPDGSEEQFTARFEHMHVLMADRTGKWRIILILPTATKESVPIHSRIFINPETEMALQGEPLPSGESVPSKGEG